MELKIFKNEEFGAIRTVEIDNDVWFVGKDVAEALGYSKARNAIAEHVDEGDALKQGIRDSLGRVQETTLINESGVYSLIFGSKLPTAKKFKHWVTSEVLPTIRKHGMYAKDELLNNPDLLIAVAQELKEERQKNAQLTAENNTMKPKALFADAVSASETSILVRDLAKLLRQNGVEIGEKRLYKWLREYGYVCKGTTTPTQKAMELGLFEIVVRTVERGNGLPIETQTIKVTGKGQVYFVNKFLSKVA